MSWTYTDSSMRVVFRVRPDGGTESVLVTEPEVAQWIAAGNVPLPAPAPTTPQLAAQARADRDSRITATDWLVNRHRDQQAAATATTLTAAQYSAMLSYRQALRDVPAQAGFPTAINWPVKP